VEPTAEATPGTRRLGLRAAASLVVASMVGTGVFTTTGYLARDLPSALGILAVWAVSGVLASFGALAYGELVVALPRNGGEYQLLRALFHPAVGFVAGFVSLFVGFAAPIAASALLFGAYLGRLVPGIPERWAAIGLVAGATLIHARRVEVGSIAQELVTIGKVILIASLGIAGLLLGEPRRLVDVGPPDAGFAEAFAVGLVYTSYSYSGWNAAAYVAGEIRDPARNLPRALILGTAGVSALYLLLNAAYLASAPLAALAGIDEVAHAAARTVAGETGARLVSAAVTFGLVSSVGALVMTGPRVAAAMGEDYPRLSLLARRGEGGAPVPALLVQLAVCVALIGVSGVEQLIAWVGLVLTLSAAMTVLGVFVLRARGLAPEDPRLRTWGHPFTSLAFVALTVWMSVHTVVARPATALWALGAIGLGLATWAISRERPPAAP